MSADGAGIARRGGPMVKLSLRSGVHRAVLLRRGECTRPLRNVAAHDFERRLSDQELLFERQVEEGERLLVARAHQRFVDPVPGDAEESNLPAGIVELSCDVLAGRRVTGAERRQIDDREGAFAHDGAHLNRRAWRARSIERSGECTSCHSRSRRRPVDPRSGCRCPRRIPPCAGNDEDHTGRRFRTGRHMP